MRLFKAIAVVAPTLCTFTTAQSLQSVLASHPTLSIFQGLLKQFDLLDRFRSFSNITILAPTNQAYLDLAQWGFNLSQVEPFIARALLSYHVLDGEWTSKGISSSGKPQIVHTLLRPPILTNVSNGAAVKLYRKGNTIISESGLQVVGGVDDADIEFENGVLHTLNSSMVLPHNISITAELNGLTEFLEILSTAHLVPVLESLEDVTVFIPHNSVLERLGPLLHMLEPRKLADILGYHVVPGKVLYGEMLSREDGEFTTLHGAVLNTRADQEGTVFVNGGKVLRSDLIIYGGVAHVIDDVLVPSSTLAPARGGSSQREFSSSLAYQVPFSLTSSHFQRFHMC